MRTHVSDARISITIMIAPPPQPRHPNFYPSLTLRSPRDIAAYASLVPHEQRVCIDRGLHARKVSVIKDLRKSLATSVCTQDIYVNAERKWLGLLCGSGQLFSRAIKAYFHSERRLKHVPCLFCL